jgi:hypothetical protein
MGTPNQKFFVYDMLTSGATLKIFVRLKIEDREEPLLLFHTEDARRTWLAAFAELPWHPMQNVYCRPTLTLRGAS